MTGGGAAEEGMDIGLLKRQLAAAKAGWEAEDNALVRLPMEEQKRWLGYEPRENEPTLAEREMKAAANKGGGAKAPAGAGGPQPPSAFDLRNVGGSNFITPVKDQESCGSCVAFGVCGTIEGTVQFRRNNPALGFDRSEAHLFYCIGSSTAATCGSGWYVTAALNGCQTTGVVDEPCFPYTPGDQPCKACADWKTRVYKISSWATLGSLPAMKQYISTKGPLVACFTVYQDFYAYKSGVYTHVSGANVGGHCICVVGYDDAQNCWICKNSWGSGWGENGFFRIRYGEVGIDATMWSAEAT